MSMLNHLRQWRENSRKVLSINHRNLGYIYSYNERRHFNLADDKVLAKKVLSNVGVPVPDTYLLVDSFYQVNRIDPDLEKLNDFVIKPAQGRGGGGILVITDKLEPGWRTASGRIKSNEDIKRHVADIVFGNHSFDKSDVAIFEERLIPAELLHELSPWGLPDVRIIAFNNQLIMAMCRIPTKDSGGRANIHQGAVAVGLEMARLCAQTLPLKYLGIDIAISIDGPKILEVNARPGLAIQLANDRGLQPALLAALDA